MNLLQFFFITSGLIILILAIDVAKRQKFNAIHFLVFIGVGIGLLVFTFFPNVLNFIGSVFGLQRGADVLVYSSIIFLFYFTLLLVNKIEKNNEDFTILVRELSIYNSIKQDFNGKYAFVIPAYNEGKVISNTVGNIIKKGYKNIIVINDGSKDNTLQELSKYKNEIIILNHLKNRGQGAALETGFEYIRRFGNVDYVITFDSDGQHSLDDIKNFEIAISENPKAKVFLGSRFKGNALNIKLSKKIILKLGILFTFFISSIKLSDAHNGYRIIKKEALNDIKIRLDGMEHASEIVDLISQKKIPYVEVPVVIKYDEYSLQKGQKSSNAINIGLKMIWVKFFR